MRCENTPIEGIRLLHPQRHHDSRGWFQENFRLASLSTLLGFQLCFEQSNLSFSQHGVLRGLHMQRGQGKLLTVVQGSIFDVMVDARRHSATFGQSFTHRLDGHSGDFLWLPPGIAHGFLTLSANAHVQYWVTTAYAPEQDRTLLWRDDTCAVAWPLHELSTPPIVSERDQQGLSWAAFSA